MDSRGQTFMNIDCKATEKELARYTEAERELVIKKRKDLEDRIIEISKKREERI